LAMQRMTHLVGHKQGSLSHLQGPFSGTFASCGYRYSFGTDPR